MQIVLPRLPDAFRVYANKWGKPLHDGLHWWAAELKDCIPVRVRHWLKENKQTALVRLSATGFQVDKSQPDVGAKAADAHNALGSEDATVYVDRSLLLTKTVRLPAAVKDDIQTAVAIQVKQHIPLTPEHLATGYAASDDEDQIRVRIAAARLKVLEERLAEVRQAGYEPVSVVSDDKAVPINVPSVQRYVARYRWVLFGLSVLILVQLLVLPVVDVNRVAKANDALQGKLTTLMEKTKSASDLKKVVDRRFADAEFLQTQVDNDAFVETLAFLSRESPNDIWVTDFQYDGKEFRLSGFGRDAAGWVLKLQETGRFKNARLDNVAAGTDDGTPGRFQIRLEVAEREKKQ